MKLKRTKNNNQILPITSFLAIIGPFFTIASIAYVVTILYCDSLEKRIVMFAIEGTIIFVAILLAFFRKGIKKTQQFYESESYKGSQVCLKCIEKKMNDGFHNRGLLHLNELIAYEGELSLSRDPSCCKVLVYTSDLATENDAEIVVKKNIENGVQYIVLYFANTCDTDEYNRIKNLYGENNLVNLSEIDEYKTSFDGLLACTLGFDIMIYKNIDNMIKGFFAVDFVPEKRPIRICHDINCEEQCNYGKGTEAFYKEISYERAKQLYEEGLNIHKDYLKNKERHE